MLALQKRDISYRTLPVGELYTPLLSNRRASAGPSGVRNAMRWAPPSFLQKTCKRSVRDFKLHTIIIVYHLHGCAHVFCFAANACAVQCAYAMFLVGSVLGRAPNLCDVSFCHGAFSLALGTYQYIYRLYIYISYPAQLLFGGAHRPGTSSKENKSYA